MEGVIKLGKVISHNWSERLQKVTRYDMQFADGTILENVRAEDILVTEASMEEAHHGHEAKKDDEELEENLENVNEEKPREIMLKYEDLPPRLKKLADEVNMGGSGQKYNIGGVRNEKEALRRLEARFRQKKRKKDKEKEGSEGKNESWFRGNKDDLLFERLVKKWTK